MKEKETNGKGKEIKFASTHTSLLTLFTYWSLLTEFEVCNLSYVTGFFHSDLWPKHKGVGHKSGGEK